MNMHLPSRRRFLSDSALGFGQLALAAMLSDETRAATSSHRAGTDPLAAQIPLIASRAKRVIFLFMFGGVSHIDTFDPKPIVDRDHGKPLPFPKPRIKFDGTGNLLRSPWKFRQYGDSGIPVSELFPHMAECVDEMCLIHSMHGTNVSHGAAILKMHTGTDTFVRPSLGSWVTYGLGTENRNLPGFITISPSLAYGGVKNWSSAFLPAAHQGTALGSAHTPAQDAKVRYIKNPRTQIELQRLQLDILRDLDQKEILNSGWTDELEGRINSFELAYRMQSELPNVQDISDETAETLKLYGIDQKETANFGRQCLMARRFAERGVRFIQATHVTKITWDQHYNIKEGHELNAGETDKPVAGLLKDLRQRGLLDDTLVLWGGEFGRTSTVQGEYKKNAGRDHNPGGFTIWLAGGGVKPGIRYGKTDDYGYYAIEDKVHIHDLHATLLHLLGLDHEKLTYHYAGRDFRLTDVEGRVVHDIIA